ncbi:MAG: HAD-IB family phosphatase [Methylobacter tundripaludum]|uniref:phosphoserine phosphatase n=1 Tax=Methylobacter tundripaludum TaxID=173365 RepID=A0A2S6GFK8_9GAMM|nr:HAD-IB family phosphatase [Methylobacter tundripaludum]MCF7965420.1 HAD-IB family phosphatase [Methylobacter tundripaludum]PPK64002.1 phosphoserine phosphatase [Methylobacter tundripaludum]
MSFDVICFDCDSTLSKIEGIDELAGRVGLGEEMSRLTDAAMNGEVLLEAVYEQRLSLIRPDRDSIDWLADLYIEQIVDGVKEVFETLTAPGREVHIVSGGIRQAILPLARYLSLPETQVHAVDIYFNEDGSYRDYDRDSPLARSGGKAEICKRLLKAQGSLVMVGDGKTDMEARQAGAVVIGFGGVADRPVVREQADFYSAEPSLVSILSYIL